MSEIFLSKSTRERRDDGFKVRKDWKKVEKKNKKGLCAFQSVKLVWSNSTSESVSDH